MGCVIRLAKVAAAALIAGALSACGVAGAPASQPSAPAKIAGCAASADAIAQAPEVVKTDLDGDGKPESLRRVTQPGLPCTGALVAVIGGRLSGAAVAEPGKFRVRAVRLAPGGRQYAVVTVTHPRGGFATHIFGEGDDGLAELSHKGHPVVAFVATDTNTGYVDVTCGDPGALVVRTARAHEPPGVIATWDIWESTYIVSGTVVSTAPETKVADNVLPEEMAAKFPTLVKHRILTDCVD